MKRLRIVLLAAGLIAATATALSGGDTTTIATGTTAGPDGPASVGVQKWQPGRKGGVETVTEGEKREVKVRVEGEDVYVNGVLQKQKYTPGSRLEFTRDGQLVVVPPPGQPAAKPGQ